MLTKCPGCENDVSTEAVSCPRCGHQFKAAGGINLSDPVHLLGIFLVIGFAVGILFYILYAA